MQTKLDTPIAIGQSLPHSGVWSRSSDGIAVGYISGSSTSTWTIAGRNDREMRPRGTQPQLLGIKPRVLSRLRTPD